MKKNSIYTVVAALGGLLIGYLIFGQNTNHTDGAVTHEHSRDVENEKWTCSMHPQIMQSESGDCPICGMDLIPAETITEGVSPKQFKMTENAMALANIQTTVVGTMGKDLENKISLSGKITANQEAMTVQASYFEGRIERLNVNYQGQEIQKGQLIATIYSPELVAAQQELLTAASLKTSQPQLYQAVRTKLKLWKLSEKQISAIENSGKITENFPVYATVSGTVSEVMTAEGNYVKKGQPIAKLSNLKTVWAVFDAYENQLSQFKKGQKLSITTNAYPNKTFPSVISFINPVLNDTKRIVEIRATLNNQQNLFKPGMFVAAKIDVDQKIMTQEQLVVPESAVLWTGKRSLVYVKINASAPIFEMREVVLGDRKGKMIGIHSGLNPGEEIVTNGTFTVDAAAQLQGKKSMMSMSDTMTRKDDENSMKMQHTQSTAILEYEKNSTLTTVFKNDFEKMLLTYYDMKDAFVAGASVLVAQKAKNIVNQLKEMDHTGLGTIEVDYITKSITLLENISNTSDIAQQREQFVLFNQNIVAIVSNIRSLKSKIYIQQCPMANNNKGAVWLSTKKEIRNPYYGDAMLRCGSIIQTLE